MLTNVNADAPRPNGGRLASCLDPLKSRSLNLLNSPFAECFSGSLPFAKHRVSLIGMVPLLFHRLRLIMQSADTELAGTEKADGLRTVAGRFNDRNRSAPGATSPNHRAMAEIGMGLNHCWTSVGAGLVSACGAGAFAAVSAPGFINRNMARPLTS